MGALEGLGVAEGAGESDVLAEKSKGASSIHKRRMTVQARRGRRRRWRSRERAGRGRRIRDGPGVVGA